MLCFRGTDTTLFTHLHAFIHHHIRDVHVIAESVPTGKVLLQKSRLAYVTEMELLIAVFTKSILRLAANLLLVSSINLVRVARPVT